MEVFTRRAAAAHRQVFRLSSGLQKSREVRRSGAVKNFLGMVFNDCAVFSRETVEIQIEWAGSAGQQQGCVHLRRRFVSLALLATFL